MKKIILSCHIFFALFFLLSLVFFKERTLYVDCSAFMMDIVNHGFSSASGRHGVFISQVLTVLAVNMGLPMQWVLLIFSASFVLLYYGVFLICVYALKQPEAGIVILLTLFMLSAETFFHIVTETHQGMVYVILLYAWIRHDIRQRSGWFNTLLYYLVATLLIILCYFTHPVTLFPILFVLGFDFSDKLVRVREEVKPSLFPYIIIAVLTLCIFSWRALTTDSQSYDGQFYTQLFANLNVPFFSLRPLDHIWRLKTLYMFPAIVLIITVWCYIRYREYLKLLIVSGGFLAYMAIVQYAFGQGDSSLMMEKNYMPLGIFLGIPFCYDVLRKTKKEIDFKFAVIVCLLCISFIRIINFSSFFTERVSIMQRLYETGGKLQHRKFIVEKGLVPEYYAGIAWCFSVETLLYSAIHGPDSSRTFFIDQGFDYNEVDFNTPGLYLGPYFKKGMGEDELNKTYFDLKQERYIYLRGTLDSMYADTSIAALKSRQ
jgi:hypothetical protein